jgi:hypothetical protein
MILNFERRNEIGKRDSTKVKEEDGYVMYGHETDYSISEASAIRVRILESLTRKEKDKKTSRERRKIRR